MLHDTPSKLLKDARLNYKEVSFGWKEDANEVARDGVPEEIENNSFGAKIVEEQSKSIDIFDNESVISNESAKKNDLNLLGVELDESTINRLENNLGQTLFSTAQKAANTIRASNFMRNDIQTPMGGHLVDESFLRFTNDQSNDISRVSEPKPVSPAPAGISSLAIPKSMRMSASFADNRDYFLPLASGADEMTSNSIEKSDENDDCVEEDISSLHIIDEIERVQSERTIEEEASAVNNSLDYYRKKRSIFRTDLNEIMGQNDCSGIEEVKMDSEHSYLKNANASAAFAIEKELRPDIDKLLLAIQVDYMKNPDKFVRRLFGFPLNAPKVSMKVIEKIRYVGESTFFDTMRQMLRAKEASDKVRSHADIKIENELIWSLFQLLVEKRRLPGEKHQRPVVDLWDLVRKLKTGNRLRALYKEGRPVTKEEIEDYAILSNFHKLDKTNEPIPDRPFRINALEREVQQGNQEIEEERKRVGSVAWRNKSPPRRAFDNVEGKGLHQFAPRPSDVTMLQILNHGTTKDQRIPIDDRCYTRKFSGVPCVRASKSSMAAIIQQKSDHSADQETKRPSARREHFEKSQLMSNGVSELLDVEAWRPEKDERSLKAKKVTESALTKGENKSRNFSRSNSLHATWNASSVSDALHGRYDTSAKSHPRGNQLSEKAITRENESGDSKQRFQDALYKQRMRESNVSNQGTARESLVALKAAEQSADNHMPAVMNTQR